MLTEEQKKRVSDLVNYLVSLAKRDDRAALAELRRLRQPGGPRFTALRHIIGFLPEDEVGMDSFILVAGLFATHPEQAGGRTLGAAVKSIEDRSGSMDRRFHSLLDADRAVMQMLLPRIISILKAKGIGVDYRNLLETVLDWDDPERPRRLRWARDFVK